MRMSFSAGVVAVAAVALGIGLAGCGSDTKTAESTSSKATSSSKESTTESSTTTSKAAPTSPTEAAGPNKTIADSIKENNIVEPPVPRGDPGAPNIALPMPPGWEDAGSRAPEW